jgi:hypothetical protein
MKETSEAMRNREMGSCKATRVVSFPQTTLQPCIQDRQKSLSEAIQQNWVGSKFFLVKQKVIWLNAVF